MNRREFMRERNELLLQGESVSDVVLSGLANHCLRVSEAKHPRAAKAKSQRQLIKDYLGRLGDESRNVIDQARDDKALLEMTSAIDPEATKAATEVLDNETIIDEEELPEPFASFLSVLPPQHMPNDRAEGDKHGEQNQQ